ncbi:hypothetical protein D3C78_1021080 [compost metagenome]
MHAVFACKLVDRQAQFLELIAQPVGVRRCQIAELVDAAGQPCDVFAQVANELLVFRYCANIADFGAQALRFARNALGNIVLQLMPQIDERLRNLLQCRVVALRFLIGRDGTRTRGGGGGLLRVPRTVFRRERSGNRPFRAGGGFLRALEACFEEALALADFVDGVELRRGNAGAWLAGRGISFGFGLDLSARTPRVARELLAHQPFDTGFKAFNGAIESIKRRSVAWLLVFRSQSVHLFARFASARRARLSVATLPA